MSFSTSRLPRWLLGVLVGLSIYVLMAVISNGLWQQLESWQAQCLYDDYRRTLSPTSGISCWSSGIEISELILYSLSVGPGIIPYIFLFWGVWPFQIIFVMSALANSVVGAACFQLLKPRTGIVALLIVHGLLLIPIMTIVGVTRY